MSDRINSEKSSERLQINVAGINITNGIATCASNAATLNTNAGIITTESLTTAGGSNQAIVLTNSQVSAGDIVLIQLQGGTNTTKNITFSAVVTANTITVTVYNNTASTALNGTIFFSFVVVKVK